MSSSRKSGWSTSCAPVCACDRRRLTLREPSRDERTKEASFLYSTLADVGNVSQFIVVAILSGSLTILSEAVRGALMIVISFYSLWLLRAVHRETLRPGSSLASAKSSRRSG